MDLRWHPGGEMGSSVDGWLDGLVGVFVGEKVGLRICRCFLTGATRYG